MKPLALCTAVPHLIRRWWFAGALAVLLILATLWILSTPRPAISASARADYDRQSGDVARGRRIFAAGDCASCHASPGQSDRLWLGGGMALASPFGTFRAPNISPHKVDGIGQWQASDLANALLSGVSPENQHYYPALPYTSYGSMRSDDIVDLYAYLQTLQPVAGQAPPHEIPLLFKLRRGIGLWKQLYFAPQPMADQPARAPQWNRGRYLVEAVAHCAECHSARNVLGAIEEASRFAGGRDLEGTGFVPNITPTGIGGWSAAQVARLLRDGQTPDGRVVGSSMADVVANTASLSEDDRAAIAEFIVSLPARPTPKP